MIEFIKEGLWRQFGASIDMLANAIGSCTQDLLDQHQRIFYTSYHVLVFLEYYLSIPPKDFVARLPFTLQEMAAIPAQALDDVIPDRSYTREELLDYLAASREKCRHLIFNLTEKSIQERFREEDIPGGMDYSLFEILLYNMRHVQHHTAQLNLYLRTHLGDAPTWIGRTSDPLDRPEPDQNCGLKNSF
jgi:hypothetical protein